MLDDYSRAVKRQEMCLGPNSDFISNFPDNVTDQILVRLPLLDAVRTSILSTNWRYKWTTIPQLVFCDHDRLCLPSPPLDNKDKFTNFIDRVLLLHTGFIHKFELSSVCLSHSSSMIDVWIRFLLIRNIKELVLRFSSRVGERYKLPSRFFSAQQISTLELEWCVLMKPPPTFTGFSHLKSLNLQNTTYVDSGGLEYLISKCPVLERLTLICVPGLGNLKFCSPNLKFLRLACTFKDICFENTPLLSDVNIDLNCNITDEMAEKFLRTETRNMVKVLSSLPCLKKFVVNERFVKFLSLCKIPVKLPFPCHHLNNLTLSLSYENLYVICVTLCLLGNSPNLRELNIISYPWSKPGHDNKNFWEKGTCIDSKWSRLQVVKITSYDGFEFKSDGLEFIKLLLANSPMLEMLSIRPYRSIHGRHELMTPGQEHMALLFQLLRFKRASPKAVIEFPDFV